MKNINTLISDIQERISSGKPFDEETVTTFGKNLAAKLANRLAEHRGRPTLRLSNLGTRCARKLWYNINQPEMAEPLPPSTRFKFLFGDILEEVVLFLARAAGHTVEREQEEVEIAGVKGHIDGTVDGHPIDVKSASTYSFGKFKDGLTSETDSFGYLTQIGAYRYALRKKAEQGGPPVENTGSFIAVDKTLGHLVLDRHGDNGVDYEEMVKSRQEMLAKPDVPPREYPDEEAGGGNRKLGLICSYCDFKKHCWPGVRTFAYARGPVFLTDVAKLPRNANGPIPEILNEAEG